MARGVEQMRVAFERDLGRRVAELARDEDDVESLRDQEARRRVPQVVPAQPLLAVVSPPAQRRLFAGRVEGSSCSV